MNKIDKFLGLNLRFSWTTLILIFLASSGFNSFLSQKFPDSLGATAIAGMIASFVLIFSIVFHEMSHVYVGRAFGIDFSRITIFVLGGAAHMSKRIPSAKAEFYMAIAGPVGSFILAAVLSLLATLIGVVYKVESIIVATIMLTSIINLMLAIFNLIPAFPLDGGRVFRAAIWHITGDLQKATRYGTWSGKILGTGLMLSGVAMALGVPLPYFGQGIGDGIWMGMIGFIIILMAKQELKQSMATG
jgi:Zn-dependent protease